MTRNAIFENYRPDIDGLRTIAVVPVILFHANVAGFTGGYVGVDIFFVISGFLITSIIQRELAEGRFSIARFYERRARRILPALFAVISACLIAGWFILPPSNYDDMGHSILSALFFASNMWFWRNSGGYFDGATDYLPMLHTWSLAVEEQFYIFFPLLLMLLHKITRRLILPAVLVLVLVSLMIAAWATPRMPSASFYILPTRIWELGMGALLALGLLPTNAPKILREGFGALGLIAVFVPVFLYDGSTKFPGLNALPPVLGAAALIWAGTAGSVAASRLLALRPMVGIGLISYSLYLWHWPIMAFVRNRLFMVELEPIWQGGTVLASFLAGWISWRFIERPFRVPAREQGLSQGRIFALSGVGMTVLGAFAGAVIVSDGAEVRISAYKSSMFLKNPLENRFHESCFGSRPIEELCTFGNDNPSAPVDWLLWGDSHADAILPAFVDIAEKKGKKLLFASASGCPPLPGVARTDVVSHRQQDCFNFNKNILEMISESSTLSDVFLHARWALYASGKYTEDDGPQPLRLFKYNENIPLETEYDPRSSLLQTSLIETIEKAELSRINVTIVGPVPEIPWDVYKHLSARAMFGFRLPPAPTEEQITERQAGFQAIVTTVLKETDARYIELSGALCSPICQIHNDEAPFYRDDDHLTPFGARHLIVPILTAAIK